MHDSVRDFGRLFCRWRVINWQDVLEVGSLNVNGSLRELIEPMRPASYTGVDMREGPGVDEVVPAESLPEWAGDRKWDLVICTEMLEHAENWREALYGVKHVVEPTGYLLLTTRSPGFGRHDHPGDHWRYPIDFFRVAMTGFYAHALLQDPDAPGILYWGERWTSNDSVLAIPEDLEPFPAPTE